MATESYKDVAKRVEMTVAAVDMPEDTPTGKQIRQQLEWALLMLSVKRDDTATVLLDRVFEMLDQIDQ